MTIGTKKPNNNNPRKCKKPIDEKSALLPERQGYDENDEVEEDFNGASFAGAVFNLSTNIIGAGIMALPAAMKVLGVGFAIGVVVFVAVLTEASVEMLLRFSRVGNSVSYGGVMGDSFGRIGKLVFQICILVNNLGILIVYMIIIGKFLQTFYVIFLVLNYAINFVLYLCVNAIWFFPGTCHYNESL